jgi:uncharacterized integral membrane protein
MRDISQYIKDEQRAMEEAEMLFLVLFFALLCLGLTFLVFYNMTPVVEITIYHWSTVPLPLGIWIASAFCLGVVLMYFIALFSAWGDQRELKRLRKRVARLSKQTLSTTPMPGVTGQIALPEAPNTPSL